MGRRSEVKELASLYSAAVLVVFLNAALPESECTRTGWLEFLQAGATLV